MAVCEIWDVRGRLDHPIDYAENPEKTANPKYTEADLQAMVDVMEYATNKNKTEQRFFVTGVNCDPTTASDVVFYRYLCRSCQNFIGKIHIDGRMCIHPSFCIHEMG
jgi:hypothetical protein